MNQLRDSLKQATVLLETVSRLDWAELPDDEVCGLIEACEQAGRLIDTARVKAAAEVAERSRFELGGDGLSMKYGHRKPVHLVEQLTRVSQAEAARRMRLGAAIRPRVAPSGELVPPRFARLAAAMAVGDAGFDAAGVIIRCLEQGARGSAATVELLDAAEQSLVTSSATEGADLVSISALAWREALDPDGAQPRFEEIHQRRGLVIGRERNGLTHIHITSDPVTTALVKAALAESTAPAAGPRFLADDDPARGVENHVVTDTRTRAQKQFDIFAGVLGAGLRATHDAEANQRSTGRVTAVISLENLLSNSGVGWLDDSSEPVPASVIDEIVCDSGFMAMVMGERGEPLWQGRQQRLFTPPQRRALAVRDGGCVAVGCNAPPSWCHAHHVVPWQSGGLTDVDNGVLLCPAHHHALHTGAFEIRMAGGRPELRIAAAGHQTQWMPVGACRALLEVA